MYATTLIDRGGISDIEKRDGFACAFKIWWHFSTGDVLAWHIEQLDVHFSGRLRSTICRQSLARMCLYYQVHEFSFSCCVPLAGSSGFTCILEHWLQEQSNGEVFSDRWSVLSRLDPFEVALTANPVQQNAKNDGRTRHGRARTFRSLQIAQHPQH